MQFFDISKYINLYIKPKMSDFNTNLSYYTYITRNSRALCCPTQKSQKFQDKFYYQGIKHFNLLPNKCVSRLKHWKLQETKIQCVNVITEINENYYYYYWNCQEFLCLSEFRINTRKASARNLSTSCPSEILQVIYLIIIESSVIIITST